MAVVTREEFVEVVASNADHDVMIETCLRAVMEYYDTDGKLIGSAEYSREVRAPGVPVTKTYRLTDKYAPGA